MIELLILYILFNEKNTQYGVRKIIKDKFSYLTSATFGTIHPAIIRLLSKGFLEEKKTSTEGGRKKNIYSITKEGKAHLIESLKADFPFNTPNLEKMINTKLSCADILEDGYRKTLYVKIVRYYQQQIFSLNKSLKNNNYNQIQILQVKNLIQSFENKANFIEELL